MQWCVHTSGRGGEQPTPGARRSSSLEHDRQQWVEMEWTPPPFGDERLGNRSQASRTERHRCAKVELPRNHLRNGGPEMNATTYGLDVAKRVLQMYWVDAQTGEIVNRRF